MHTTRRAFLQSAAMSGLALGLGRTASAGEEATPQAKQPDAKPAPGKLNLLILGGTGFLGPHIVRRAVERGHAMTLFNRGKSNPNLFPGLQKLVGDRNAGELDALKGRKFDAVIDTSAYVPDHVTATALMLGEHAQQYVLLSSCSVYADTSKPNIDETAPVIELTDEVVATMKTIRESIAHYGGMKARCEQAAEQAMPGRVTNIRPGLIVGPGDYSDRFTYWPVRIERGGEVLAPGDGSDPIQYIDARDLADWIIHALEQRIMGVFNAITPAGWFNTAEMLYGIKGAFWTDTRFTWVDAEFLETQGIQPWSHMPVWIPAEGEYAGFHLQSADKIVTAGMTYRPLADTAQATVAWQKAERPADYAFGERAGISQAKEAELLAAWKRRATDKSAENPG